MTRIREIHGRHAGCAELNPCKQCNLPLQTYPEQVSLGEWSVTAEKYVSGVQKVYELKTPDKFRRPGLKV
jgi:hypothetical protein